jgi:hypothetical protein
LSVTTCRQQPEQRNTLSVIPVIITLAEQTGSKPSHSASVFFSGKLQVAMRSNAQVVIQLLQRLLALLATEYAPTRSSAHGNTQRKQNKPVMRTWSSSSSPWHCWQYNLLKPLAPHSAKHVQSANIQSIHTWSSICCSSSWHCWQ